MKKLFFYSFPLFAVLVGCATQVKPVPQAAFVEPLVRSLGPGLILEVDPRLEFLAGVQSQTSWSTNPQSAGYLGPYPRRYITELRDAFASHRSDPAVVLSESLLRDRGFSYDAPPAFALASANGLGFEVPSAGYGEYLETRAGGSERLVQWGAALRNLAVTMDFPAFFRAHRPYYEGLLDQASQGLDAAPLAQWLKDYYGSQGEFVFHFALAPAMLPGGGYGTTVVRVEDGREVKHVYQVIRNAEKVDGASLVGLTLHEFGHSFVNPAIGDQIPSTSRADLERLWVPVKDQMATMAYNSVEVFLNELVLRATTIRGQLAVGQVSEAGARSLLDEEARRGFYPIHAVAELLRDYEANRDRWPRFGDFGPELLARLAAQSGELVEQAPGKPRRYDSVKTGFEGPDSAPGRPFALFDGASTTGDGSSSLVVYDSTSPAAGQASLTLEGTANTSEWHFVAVELKPQKGTVVARFQVRAQDLRKEKGQFNNAYAGFIVEDKQGKKRFEVHPYKGSFDWTPDEIRFVVDPAATKSLRFGFFLSVSGKLSIDEVSVDWE